jgi:hypothetical protein
MNHTIMDAEMLLARYRASLEALRDLATDVLPLVRSEDAREREHAARAIERALAACRRAAGG